MSRILFQLSNLFRFRIFQAAGPQATGQSVFVARSWSRQISFWGEPYVFQVNVGSARICEYSSFLVNFEPRKDL
jgi:hypothetical protein